MTNIWAALALACLASTAAATQVHARQVLQANTPTTCPANTAALTAAYNKNKAEAVRVYSLFNSTANATASDCVALFCVGLKVVIDAGAIKTTPTNAEALASLPDDCTEFEAEAATAVLGSPFYEDASAISDSACASVIPVQLPTLGATCGGLIQWPAPVPQPPSPPVPQPPSPATVATNGTRSVNATVPSAAGKLTCGLGVLQLAVAAAALLISALLTA